MKKLKTISQKKVQVYYFCFIYFIFSLPTLYLDDKTAGDISEESAGLLFLF